MTTPSVGDRELSRARRATGAAVLVAISGVAALGAIGRGVPVEEPTMRRVDLNRASVHDLQLLPNVGPAIASRIVADREENGPFPTVDDLERVPGIGERTVRRLRDHAMVGP